MAALWPTLMSPIERGNEQYTDMAEMFIIAEKMRSLGVRIDMSRAQAHIQDARERATQFVDLFCTVTGLPESALGAARSGSTDKVRSWFLEQGAPDVSVNKITGKPQFNAVALTTWAKDYIGEPFSEPAAALLGLRKAQRAGKFAQSYHDVAARHDGRVHFGFNPLGTKTGRWSSSASWTWRDSAGRLVTHRLNAQNVPNKTQTFTFRDAGELPIMVSLRDCFVPDYGCAWVKADYEALEARLIAYVTGAPKLVEWIDAGKDIHMEHARALFPEAAIPDWASKEHKQFKRFREAAKPCVYALTYQAPSDKGDDKYTDLFNTLKQLFPSMDVRVFKIMCARFFALHPEIRKWQKSVAVALKKTGSVLIPQSGRRLYYPSTMRGRNQAQNVFFQGGGAALINRALLKLAPYSFFEVGSTSLLLQVHDELSFQVNESRLDAECARIESIMGAPMQFGSLTAGVPAKADIGPNWGATQERK